MMRRTLSAALVGAFFAVAIVNPSHSLQLTLEDPFPANTKVRIETLTGTPYPFGIYHWEVDGRLHLQRQWFWYRIGNTAESNVGSLPPFTSPLINDTNENSYDDELVAAYEDPAGLRITLILRLRGGGTGTFSASMTETVMLEKLSPSSMDVTFFQYTDFNLTGGPPDDHLELSGASLESARQDDPATIATQTITAQLPTQFEVDAVDGINDLLTRLGDPIATTLANFPGPIGGNASYAYGWDFTLGASGTSSDSVSFQIEKKIDPRLAPTLPTGGPVLGAILALILGVSALVFTRRLRTRI